MTNTKNNNMKSLAWVIIMLISVLTVSGQKETTCPLVKIVPERLPDLTMPRSGHSIFFVNRTGNKERKGNKDEAGNENVSTSSADVELTIVGGHTTNFVPTPTAEYYADGKWHQMQMAYTHDNTFAVVLRSGEVIIGGGHDEPLGVGQTYMVERYHPDTHSFEGFGCLDRRRVLANATQLADGRVIIAGNHYADDAIGCYDGKSQVQHIGDVVQGRANPYILRTAEDNAIIVGLNDLRDNQHDSIWADQVKGEAFRIPLLEQWHLVYTDQPFSSDACAIGDNSYLLTVTDSSRQLGIVLVEDTCFTMLPTVCNIPMSGPYGPIHYKGPIVIDRERQRGYVIGVDGGEYYRQYILTVEYGQRPAALTLYYTDSIAHSTIAVPVVTPEGDLILAGGIPNDNYKPLSAVWLYHFGTSQPKETAMHAWFWIILGIIFVATFAYIYIYARNRKKQDVSGNYAMSKSEMQGCDGNYGTSKSEMQGSDGSYATSKSGMQGSDGSYGTNKSEMPDSAAKQSRLKNMMPTPADKELMQRICKLLEEDNLYLQNPIRQSDIASRLGVSIAAISSSISSCRGISYAQLLAEYRIRYAQELLSNNPDLKIAAVVIDSGFTSESTFFRTFKAVTGLSPKEWLAQQPNNIKS